MFTCIYSGERFERAPREHILQNFLGARWDSPRIVCADVQSQFSRTIDLSLERGLQPIRNMFGTLGGRGDTGAILRGVKASSGELIDMEPGFQPRLHEPILQVTPRPDGYLNAHIRLGTHEQLGWALHLLREQYPHIRIDESEAREAAHSAHDYIRGNISLELCFGGPEYFRGALKACFNRLSVEFGDIALDSCFDPVRSFILNGSGDMTDFVAWVRSADQLAVPRLGPIDQFIGIVSRGSSVQAVVQFFGDVVHAFRLTNCYTGPGIKCGYLVDPTRQAEIAETRSPEFNEHAIPDFDEQSRENSEEVRSAHYQRVSRIVVQFYEQANRRALDQLVKKVIGPGEPFTKQVAAKLATAVAQHMLRLPSSRG